MVVALPCDLHASTYRDALRAGKHLYGEKPLAPTLAECDLVAAEAARSPGRVVHVGYQRRSNPRYRDGVSLIRRGDLGPPTFGSASWVSSNGPMNGHDDWLARRARSGDWMVEQAVHVWDVFGWLQGEPPARAFGHGRRDLFADVQPGRDVTDHYSVQLEWADGFHATFTQSWVAPADEAFTGVLRRVTGRRRARLRHRFRHLPCQDPAPAGHPPRPPARHPHGLASFPRSHPVRTPRAPAAHPRRGPRDATAVGLLVRKAVDERRVVTWDEVQSGA